MAYSVPIEEVPPTRADMEPRHRHISPTTFIVFATLFIFSTFALGSRQNANTDWDLLIFTQNWPLSVCVSWEEKGGAPNHTCLLPNSSIWTIHGVWPTKLGTIGPGFCNTDHPFDPQAIYGILPQLEARWTPVEVHKKKNTFWKHEWEKHGSCASSLPELSTEVKYFSKGLSWSDEYEMSAILKKAGIVPGQAYEPHLVFNSVKKVLGKNPHIACFDDKKRGVSFLMEIRICFDKSLKLVDCDGTMVRRWTSHYGRRTPPTANFTGCLSDKVLYPDALPPPFKVLLPKEHFLISAYKTLKLIDWMTA